MQRTALQSASLQDGPEHPSIAEYAQSRSGGEEIAGIR